MFVDVENEVETLVCRLSTLHSRGPVRNVRLGAEHVNHVAKRFQPVERKSDFVQSSNAQIRITRRRYA